MLTKKRERKQCTYKLSMMAYVCDPSIWEDEAGGLPEDWGQPGIHKTMLKKIAKKNNYSLSHIKRLSSLCNKEMSKKQSKRWYQNDT